jgi:hypothetical protein
VESQFRKTIRNQLSGQKTTPVRLDYLTNVLDRFMNSKRHTFGRSSIRNFKQCLLSPRRRLNFCTMYSYSPGVLEFLYLYSSTYSYKEADSPLFTRALEYSTRVLVQYKYVPTFKKRITVLE